MTKNGFVMILCVKYPENNNIIVPAVRSVPTVAAALDDFCVIPIVALGLAFLQLTHGLWKYRKPSPIQHIYVHRPCPGKLS